MHQARTLQDVHRSLDRVHRVVAVNILLARLLGYHVGVMSSIAHYEGQTRATVFRPDGGWGYTRCCGQTAHFDYLGRWLTPDDPERGRLVESTRGPVAIELKCPFCKNEEGALPQWRARPRMLRA